ERGLAVPPARDQPARHEVAHLLVCPRLQLAGVVRPVDLGDPRAPAPQGDRRGGGNPLPAEPPPLPAALVAFPRRFPPDGAALARAVALRAWARARAVAARGRVAGAGLARAVPGRIGLLQRCFLLPLVVSWYGHVNRSSQSGFACQAVNAESPQGSRARN